MKKLIEKRQSLVEKKDNTEKLRAAIFAAFKAVGDADKRGGKRSIMLAAEGYETINLEKLGYEELAKLGDKYKSLSPRISKALKMKESRV